MAAALILGLMEPQLQLQQGVEQQLQLQLDQVDVDV